MRSKVRRVRGRTSLLQRLAALESGLFPKTDNLKRPVRSMRACFGVGFAAGCTIGLGATLMPQTLADPSVTWLSASQASWLLAPFTATREAPSPSEHLSIERQLWWKMPITLGHVQRDIIMQDRKPDAQARFAIATRHD
jgi:hypothetical protein